VARKSRPLDIVAISVPKASDVLAKGLRERILEEALPEGTRLPAERELIAKSGLSRTSVREALRVLEVEGLISTKTGRNGGSVIRRPSSDSILHSIELFVRSHGTRMEALVETREAIEPTAARLAALYRTEEDLKELNSLQNDLSTAASDVRRFLKINLQWHTAVVRASRNELLIAFYAAISRAIHAATDYGAFSAPELRRDITRVHKRIVDAIADRDGDAAFRRMARHMHAYNVTLQRLKSEA
jgi:GntR family transcriptional regulator, transcriptional repressor for pyruvate dehydrogenase complex